MKPQYIFSALILLLAAACKPEYNTANKSEKTALKPVKVANPEPIEKPLPIYGTGQLASRKEMLLSFKVGGIIESVLVEEGQTVQQGQTIARLNKTEINAKVKQAEQAVEKLKRDLKRVKALFDDKVATLEQVQDLTTALEVAQSDLQVARFNQQYSEIKAPVSGKILRKMAEANELIQVGSPVYLVAASSGKGSYKLKVSVADKEVVQLRLKDAANIEFDAWPGESIPAFVTEIGEAANPMTGTYEVELTLEDSKFPLKNGFIGKAEIFPSAQEKLLKIPMISMVNGHGKTVEILVTEKPKNEVKSIELTAIQLGKDYFTIRQKDWNPAHQLITEGAAYVHAGQQVKVLNQLDGVAVK